MGDDMSKKRCNRDIFKNGICIGMIAGGNSKIIEIIVKQISKKSGQRVDWHCAGGKAIVKALGDIERARLEFKMCKLLYFDI